MSVADTHIGKPARRLALRAIPLSMYSRNVNANRLS
jgi:hypothetical protein